MNRLKKIILLFILIPLTLTCVYAMPNIFDEDELIDREIFFGNPDKIAMRISPDGKYISFLAPLNGVMNIWIAPSNQPNDAKPLTQDETNRGIRSYEWAQNSAYLIYSQDNKGDENWQLHAVEVSSLEDNSITPAGAMASTLKMSQSNPDEILVKMNNRVPEYFDVYKINLISKEQKLIYENKENFSSFVADENLNLRLGYKMLPSGEGELYSFDLNDLSKFTLLQKVNIEDMLTTSPTHFSSDGQFLYMIDSSGRNTSALYKLNMETKEKELIYENDKADISDILVDPTKTKLVQAVAVEHLRKEWKIIDEKISDDLKILNQIDDGDIEIISRTCDDSKWVVASLIDNGPVKYYLYDTKTKEAKFIFVSNSAQENLPLAKMHPVQIKARDGLELINYLTLPRWCDESGTQKPTSPLPMVLYVHGGPNSRDKWGFNVTHQWLANRGYAVLSVNYRGSTGFGKSFINAGDGEWGRKMHDDLVDSVNWAIENKIADKNKIAIMGGSYGGYATLVGMTMTPDIFAAGIDIVGPSDLKTLMNSIPPYWKPIAAHMRKIIGADPETAEGEKFLKERSPLFFVQNIKKPLMIVHGANDPRVKQNEADQIVNEMKKHSIPVVYLLYPDEGHGLARPENRFSFYANAEVFLANFLSGRFQSHDNNFPGSTIEIKEDADITYFKR